MEINPAAQAGAVAAELGAVVADAKRAAVLGAIGESAERGGELNLDLNAFKINRTVQSASPLAVAIEGPGLFVLQDGARRLYGRLGDFRADERGALIDSRGRAVLGCACMRLIERFVETSTSLSLGSGILLPSAVTAIGAACIRAALALAGPAICAQLLAAAIAAALTRITPAVNGMLLATPLASGLTLVVTLAGMAALFPHLAGLSASAVRAAAIP